jgi:predicted Zn-dependent protease
MQKLFYRIKISLLLISLYMLYNSCAVNPVTGKKQLVLISEEQEIAMGLQYDPEVVASFGLYEDARLQQFINEKGKEMGAISHRPGLEYNFRIVDSDIVNAFAVPGGFVYFTRGIMAHFNNEAEFAGVLGHEIGHITARHSVIQQRNQMLGQLGLIAGMIIKPELAQFGEAASTGLSLLLLKFSRDDESQSDELGVLYSSKIGYDAENMARFFKTLQRLQGGEGSIPTFLSSHPDPGNREVRVGQLAAKWKAENPGVTLKTNRNEYLKLIEGLIYGVDPKQGFVENNIFYHPELRFQFNIPPNWMYENSPTQFQMASQDGKAMMLLRLASGKTLQQAGDSILRAYNLKLIESRQMAINSIPVLAFVADQIVQDQATGGQTVSVRTLSYLYQKGNLIYHLIGVAAPNDFAAFNQVFTNSMQSFKTVTDQNILNRKPERIRIKTVSSTTTLRAALKSFGMADNRLEELAILNGMQLNDQVEKGMLIKTIGY